MNPEKVFEIAKKVYADYPVTGKEKRGCAGAIEKNDAMRLERIKRIIEQEREKVEETKVVPFEDNPDETVNWKVTINQLT